MERITIGSIINAFLIEEVYDECFSKYIGRYYLYAS
jgi:hypothetical protein